MKECLNLIQNIYNLNALIYNLNHYGFGEQASFNIMDFILVYQVQNQIKKELK